MGSQPFRGDDPLHKLKAVCHYDQGTSTLPLDEIELLLFGGRVTVIRGLDLDAEGLPLVAPIDICPARGHSVALDLFSYAPWQGVKVIKDAVGYCFL